MSDEKITELTELTSPSTVDLLPIIKNPSGTPTTEKVTLASVDTLFSATSKTLTNKTFTAPIISTISNTGTITLPTSTDTLIGKATTDTLTNKTLTAPVLNAFTGSGGAIVQTATTGNALTITRDLAAASTDSAVVAITQDNAGDDQNAVLLTNDGTGAGILIEQNGDTTVAGLQVTNAGTGMNIYARQNGVLAANKKAIQAYSSVAQINSGLAKFWLDHADSTQDVLTIRNDGTGDGLVIDQNGNGRALDIDAETANDGVIINVDLAGASPQPFQILRNDDVTGNVLMRLGGRYMWFDATGDLRESAANPTSDTGGNVIGTQS